LGRGAATEKSCNSLSGELQKNEVCGDELRSSQRDKIQDSSKERFTKPLLFCALLSEIFYNKVRLIRPLRVHLSQTA